MYVHPVKIYTSLAAFVLLSTIALGHETAALEGIPDYVYDSGCCGKDDCYKLPVENVALLEEGYVFTAPQPDYPNQKYTVSELEYGEKLLDSADGQYWACFTRPGKRCLELSGGSGHYGGACVKYADKPDPWVLRCFFRPVNA